MPDFLLDWLSGAGAEAAVFASAFISSTLMPGGSEALLAGALAQTPDNAPRIWRLVLLATAGNTMGAMTTWLIGRLIPEKEKTGRALSWLRRWGAPGASPLMASGRRRRAPARGRLAQNARLALRPLDRRRQASSLSRRDGGRAGARLRAGFTPKTRKMSL